MINNISSLLGMPRYPPQAIHNVKFASCVLFTQSRDERLDACVRSLRGEYIRKRRSVAFPAHSNLIYIILTPTESREHIIPHYAIVDTRIKDERFLKWLNTQEFTRLEWF